MQQLDQLDRIVQAERLIEPAVLDADLLPPLRHAAGSLGGDPDQHPPAVLRIALPADHPFFLKGLEYIRHSHRNQGQLLRQVSVIDVLLLAHQPGQDRVFTTQALDQAGVLLSPYDLKKDPVELFSIGHFFQFLFSLKHICTIADFFIIVLFSGFCGTLSTAPGEEKCRHPP